MRNLARIVLLALIPTMGLLCCERAQKDRSKAKDQERSSARTIGRSAIGAECNVYTDGKGHFLCWNTRTTRTGSVYWGKKKRWDEIHILGLSSRTVLGRSDKLSIIFRDPRILRTGNRRLKTLEPGRIQLTCGTRKVIYTALSADAQAQAKSRARVFSLPTYYRPQTLLRLAKTSTYLYIDRPSVTRGLRRVYLGSAGKLTRLEVLKYVYFSDRGSQRFTTNLGTLWLPVSLKGPPKQPTFTLSGGTALRLLSVPSKKGQALRRIIGASLYADLTAARVASPCDAYLSPVASSVVPQTVAVFTPESAPRLTLHVLRAQTLEPIARYPLSQPEGTATWAAGLPDAFWFKARKGPASMFVYRPGKGLSQAQQIPTTLSTVLWQGKAHVEVLRGGKRQKIPFPGLLHSRRGFYLVNGGRSLMVMRPDEQADSVHRPGWLKLIADLDRPQPSKLPIQIKAATLVASNINERVLYVATGQYGAPMKFYQVDPFRRRIQTLTNLGVSSCEVFHLLPKAGVLVLRDSSSTDAIGFYDIKRQRSRWIRLPKDRQGLRVYPQGQQPELISVGDQLIDVTRARIIGTLPERRVQTWTYDQRSKVAYFTTFRTGTVSDTRVVSFDLRQKRKLAHRDLKQVGHHRTDRRPVNGDRVYALQLRPDGSVLVIAGGPGGGK